MKENDKQLLEKLYLFDPELEGRVSLNKFAKLSLEDKEEIQQALKDWDELQKNYDAGLLKAVRMIGRATVLGPKWPSLVGGKQPVVKVQDPSLEELRKQAVVLTKEVKKLTKALEAVQLWPSLDCNV